MAYQGHDERNATQPGDQPATNSESAAELRRIAVNVAIEAAYLVSRRRTELAGATSLVPLRREGTVTAKSTPTDPVTVVDTESESYVRSALRQLRPADAVMGEEQGTDAPGDSGVLWVIDPIDGTVNFMYGIPAYAISLAASVAGVVVAGAVVDVSSGAVFSAARGAGAQVELGDGTTQELHASAVGTLSEALLGTGFAYRSERRREQGRWVAELLPEVRDIRRIGSAALDLCLVAAGSLDAHTEHGLRPWDWAAAALIAGEAGAYVRQPSLAIPATDSLITVAAAPGIAAELEALLTRIGVDDHL